jgi:hypothetical protein
LKPSNKTSGHFKPRDGEQNGTRIYQLILNSMQELPVANISQMALLDNRIVDGSANGKRKGPADVQCQRAKKKKGDSEVSPTKMSTRRGKKKAADTTSKDDGAMEVA